MGFYDLSKGERIKLVETIHSAIVADLKEGTVNRITAYFSDDVTYIRKSAYLSIGLIHFSNQPLRSDIIQTLNTLSLHPNFKVRQTVINASSLKTIMKILFHSSPGNSITW